MNTIDRKKTAVIQKYIAETFSDGDWANLGQITNAADIIYNHPRLMRSKANGDDDYDFCVAEVINTICSSNEENINLIIDFYDIDLWYEQKDKLKFERIFQSHLKVYPQYWKNGYLKVFLSHLAISKEKAKSLKDALGEWGMSSFVAHEDIEPTKEWMTEIESGLNTMDILIAMVEPGFKESNWTDQEIGYALGRQIEIIPMRIGIMQGKKV
jgi:AbiJ N-terminal domain 5/TIR domain